MTNTDALKSSLLVAAVLSIGLFATFALLGAAYSDADRAYTVENESFTTNSSADWIYLDPSDERDASARDDLVVYNERDQVVDEADYTWNQSAIAIRVDETCSTLSETDNCLTDGEPGYASYTWDAPNAPTRNWFPVVESTIGVLPVLIFIAGVLGVSGIVFFVVGPLLGGTWNLGQNRGGGFR